MNWEDVGKSAGNLLIKNAPTIGSVLGGFIPIPGGSAIGQEVGQLLANAFGTDATPDAVNTAIQNDPAAADKLQAAEAEAQSKWPALAQIAQAATQANAAEAESVNSTMRAELAAGQTWWAWRNLYGYSVTYEVVVVSNIVFYALLFDHGILRAVQDTYNFFLSWYTLRFGLLGYIHNQSTVEKVAAVTGQAPEGIVKGLVKAVKGK